MTSVYSIDRQTWPTTFSHNGVEHPFDETSSIRVQSISRDEEPLHLPIPPAGHFEPSPLRAKELIGDLDVAADREAREGSTRRRSSSSPPGRITPGSRKRQGHTHTSGRCVQKPDSPSTTTMRQQSQSRIQSQSHNRRRSRGTDERQKERHLTGVPLHSHDWWAKQFKQH